MKRVKVMMTSAVILLAIGGAFASKHRLGGLVYTKLDDVYPGQSIECQLRGTCSGSGALCRIVAVGVYYQLYYTNCTLIANGEYAH